MTPILRALTLSSALFVALAQPARAEQDIWTAEDIRARAADWLAANGRAVVAADSIGPLDSRLRAPACDDLQISGRSAGSSSFVVECKAPTVWRFVLRADFGPAKGTIAAPVASPVASQPGGARQWTVVAARSSLPSGAVLSEDSIEERLVSSPPPAHALRSASQAIGLRLTSSVAGGVALTMRNIARTPLVMKGESVTLVATGSGFQIATPARAEEDGHEGDLISVRNTKTGVTLKGRLERDKTVVVLKM